MTVLKKIVLGLCARGSFYCFRHHIRLNILTVGTHQKAVVTQGCAVTLGSGNPGIGHDS